MKTTIWVSTYALSEGITKHEAEIRDGRAWPYTPMFGYYGFAMGKDAHLTEGEANKTADLIRLKKIAAVKKQLAKLEALSFCGQGCAANGRG